MKLQFVHRAFSRGLVFLPVLLLAGGFWYLHWTSLRELQDVTAELDRHDLEDRRIEGMAPLGRGIPDAENAALVVANVAMLYDKRWPDAAFERRMSGLNYAIEAQLTPEQTTELRHQLGKVQKALLEARRLTYLPNGRFAIDLYATDLSPLLNSVQATREIANLLRWDVILLAQGGDADGACRSAQAMFNAGRSSGNELLLISLLVRTAVQSFALGAMERVLAQGQPSENVLADLQRLIERDNTEPHMYWAMRGERLFVDRWIQAIQDGNSGIASLNNVPRTVTNRMEDWVLALGSGSLNRNRALFVKYIAEVAEAVKVPIEQQFAAVAAVDAKWSGAGKLMQILKPSHARVIQAQLRAAAKQRCMIVALAAERFRLRQGRWPATLPEIPRAILSGTLIDPYDQQPIRYRRLSDGVVIYCVGTDGQDNGGKLDREKPMASGTDVGFRLWDVDKRRQPASTVNKEKR